MHRDSFLIPSGGVPRDDLIRRLIALQFRVEGPAIVKVISKDGVDDVLVQPLTDPVPHEVLRVIADRFAIRVQQLYQDPR